MLLIPAVDIKNGKCVRLTRGKPETAIVYEEDPVKAALNWQEQGAQYLHLVDLDGAFQGKPINSELIKKILAYLHIPAEIGGGIRNPADIKLYLNAGADRVILGTQAVRAPRVLAEALQQFKERIAVGIDTAGGKVAVEGWAKSSTTTALALARKVTDLGVKTIIYTDIATDGTLKGPNLKGLEEFAKNTRAKIIASGGITSLTDIRNIIKLEKNGVTGMIIGKALYTGALNFKEALAYVG